MAGIIARRSPRYSPPQNGRVYCHTIHGAMAAHRPGGDEELVHQVRFVHDGYIAATLQPAVKQ